MMAQVPGSQPGDRGGRVPASRFVRAPLSVVLLELDEARARSIRDALDSAGAGLFRIEWVTRLTDATRLLKGGAVDVVLLGPGQPGYADREVFECFRQATPHVLVLPLGCCGFRGSTTATTAAESGASATARLTREFAWLPETLRYVTRRKRAEAVARNAKEALLEEKQRTRTTLGVIGDAVLVTAPDGRVTYLNPMAEAMTGCMSDQAVGHPVASVFAIIDGASREPGANPALQAMREDRAIGPRTSDVLVSRDGGEAPIEESATPIHDRHGRVSGAVIVFRGIEQSRAMAKKMAYLAQHDALTGLPNRALLNERINQAIQLALRHQKQVALLFVDIDDFKKINDSLGHRVGDHVLQTVASMLTTCVRGSDTVSRQGGDEFVVVLSEIDKPQDAAHVANKLFAAFEAPITLGDRQLNVEVSIGISIYPDDGDNADALLEHADRAMYRAKRGDQPPDNVFETRVKGHPPVNSRIEANLHRAFQQGEFLLHYQPQVDVTAGHVVGVEALLRWLDPEQGLVHPRQFMGLAEQTGLIVPLGHWVTQEACRQVAAWRASGLWAPLLAVNVSALEFQQADFADDLETILREAGFAPGGLELEFTEDVLMRDTETSAKKLHDLREIGVHLAIDNFGTGKSSLSYLRNFPVNTIKVDRSFMRESNTSAGGAVILRSLIGIGQSLQHRVVAEGVETVQQYGFLKAQHCDAAQGFQLGRPLAAADCALHLAKRQNALLGHHQPR